MHLLVFRGAQPPNCIKMVVTMNLCPCGFNLDIFFVNAIIILVKANKKGILFLVLTIAILFFTKPEIRDLFQKPNPLFFHNH